MASPVSPGDVLDFAKAVYRLYKRFEDAPKEMKQLGEQVRLVTALIHHSDNAIMHLDFLKTAEGRNLLDILNSHLREMRSILRQIKDVAKQWQRATKNFWRRAPFILYTMRAIPGLRADLEFELNLVETVKTQAFQIGVPAALKQMEAKIAAQSRQRKSITQDEFAAIEQKRRVASTALKRSSLIKQPSTMAEERNKTLSTLKKSGLADDEAQKLLDLHEQELKEVAASLSTKNAATPVKSKKSRPKKQQNQGDKPSHADSDKPKVVVTRPKSKVAKKNAEDMAPSGSNAAVKNSTTTEEKPKENPNKSGENGSRPGTRKAKWKNAESENNNLAVPDTSKRKRSNSPAKDNAPAPNNTEPKESEKGKNPTKPNDNKKSEGEKNSNAGKQDGKGSTTWKKASEQKSETKGEQDANMKTSKKQNQAENTPVQSETSSKPSKSPAKAKKTNGTSESANTQTDTLQNKSTKAANDKKQTGTNLPSNHADGVVAETKKTAKQKGQKEIPTDQPKQIKAQSSTGGQLEQISLETQSAASSNPEKKPKQKKKKPDSKNASQEQPLAVVG